MDKELCIGFYKTPPLWLKEQFGVTQFKFPNVDFYYFSALNIPKQLRLGHKMEYAFEQLLEHTPNWQTIAKNLVVRDKRISIGELDFLLNNMETKEILHVELAYKFYIINPEISEPIHRLMGPNKRDMFYTKLDKLKEKQFPLLYSELLTKKLENLAVRCSSSKQEVCLKAQLFVPYKTENITIRPLNKNCIAGSWIRFEDFNSKEFKSWEYYIPFKDEWVINPSTERSFSSHYETLLDINLRMLKENAPMLWVKKSSDNLSKLFVVWW